MNNIFYSTYFSETDFSLSSKDEVIQFIESFSGSIKKEHQICHEFTHFFSSQKPVSRALEKLKISSLEKAKSRANEDLADQIMKFLLPIYEGLALIAEFDCFFYPDTKNIHKTFHDYIQFPQLYKRAQNQEPETSKYYQYYEQFAQSKGFYRPILAAQYLKVSSSESIERKKELLRFPLHYNKSSDCYLVAYLFMREMHHHLSKLSGKSVESGLLIKYVTSFFLEDWTLVKLILDIAESKEKNVFLVKDYLSKRIELFFSKVDNDSLKSYENSIVRYLQSGARFHGEMLDGLFCDKSLAEFQYQRLTELSINALVGSKDKSRRSYQILRSLFSKLWKVYEGFHECELNNKKLILYGDARRLETASLSDDNLKRQQRKITVYVQHIDYLPRIISIEDASGVYISVYDPYKTSRPFDPFKENYSILEEVLNKNFRKQNDHTNDKLSSPSANINDERASLDNLNLDKIASNIYTEQLRRSGLNKFLYLANKAEFPENSRITVHQILKEYLTLEEYNSLIRHSLLFGIGFNLHRIFDHNKVCVPQLQCDMTFLGRIKEQSFIDIPDNPFHVKYENEAQLECIL